MSELIKQEHPGITSVNRGMFQEQDDESPMSEVEANELDAGANRSGTMFPPRNVTIIIYMALCTINKTAYHSYILT